MAATMKIAISIDKRVLNRIDKLVKNKIFANRSRLFKLQSKKKYLNLINPH